jgi:hypothetical protein
MIHNKLEKQLQDGAVIAGELNKYFVSVFQKKIFQIFRRSVKSSMLNAHGVAFRIE